MSLLRIPVSNLINGLAAFRALQAFAMERQGKTPVKWDKTMHVEGVGSLPTAPPESSVAKLTENLPFVKILEMLQSGDKTQVLQSLVVIPRDVSPSERGMAVAMLDELSKNSDTEIRATVGKSLGFLHWPETANQIRQLMKDPEWVVRANAARALWKLDAPIPEAERVVEMDDSYATEVLVRCIEQDRIARDILFREVTQNERSPLYDGLIVKSKFLEQLYEDWMVSQQVGLTARAA
jgi:hypothetical protein